MKKLVVPIAFLAIIFASCKKENVIPATPAQDVSIEKQISDLIGKADPELYGEIYNSNPNSRAPKPTIKYCPGVFVILQGDPASGTCFPNQNVCFVIVTWPAFVTDSTETTEITGDYYVEFTQHQEGEIIMNDSVPYTIENLQSVDVKFDGQGGSTVACKVLQ